MYQAFKKVFKKIIPRTFFRQYESYFRNIIYLFFKGDKYQCNICHAKLKSFLQLPNQDLLCPKCGSLARTRRLYQIIIEKKLLKGKILHFSPPACLAKKLSQYTDIQYISSDFEKEFKAEKRYDLTNIEAAANEFDLFLAYHVLEHIEEDILAMKELYRITKKGGFGLIQTPFQSGQIYEDNSIKTEEERLKHFGKKIMLESIL